jgi:rhodanese-related sulfurtransferase
MSTYANVSVAELKGMMGENAPALIDVRTGAEVARGVIAGARHVELQTLPQRLNELPKDQTLVVYCQSGGRSAQAANFLAGQGFGPVYNLAGGILAWQREGEPLSTLAL